MRYDEKRKKWSNKNVMGQHLQTVLTSSPCCEFTLNKWTSFPICTLSYFLDSWLFFDYFFYGHLYISNHCMYRYLSYVFMTYDHEQSQKHKFKHFSDLVLHILFRFTSFQFHTLQSSTSSDYSSVGSMFVIFIFCVLYYIFSLYDRFYSKTFHVLV